VLEATGVEFDWDRREAGIDEYERSGNPFPDDTLQSIKDNGVGIPSEMLARVFDMFTQVNRDHRPSSGGLGIGLSLVRTLVEMHGGSVEAHSDGPGTGHKYGDQEKKKELNMLIFQEMWQILFVSSILPQKINPQHHHNSYAVEQHSLILLQK